ncbi:MAG: hypothetical protein HQL69_24140 [Magnetococcales bacterium]|nr:hypothetical protein [Magnetococcales bacterium]
MSGPSPPPNLVALADDDKLGFLVLLSLFLAVPGISHYMGWGDFFTPGVVISYLRLPMTIAGILLFWICIRRLLLPGCRIILRINHGGLTDFRRCDKPIEWQDIYNVTRLPGTLGELLPIIVLDVEANRLAKCNKDIWYRFIYFTTLRKPSNLLIIPCGSLDNPTSKILTTIQAHLSHKK